MQYAALNSFALLKFEGEDSLSFLQGQLSQDMNLVKGENALLASYSNPKGRVFSTFLFWQDALDANIYYALVPQDNAAFLQKRLSMFVLRAKVKIQLLSQQVYGVWEDNLNQLNTVFPFATNLFNSAESSPSRPQFTLLFHDGAYLVKYPSYQHTQRVLWVNLESTEIPFAQAEQVDEAAWQMQDILIGLPWIGNTAKEVFVAQSINQDAIGAINFKKGCYPGQEVIARSHYLGNLKRRTVIARIDVALQEPAALITKDVLVADNPVGQVVNACSFAGKTYLLLEVQLQAIQDAKVVLADSPSHEIHLEPIPYSLEKPE